MFISFHEFPSEPIYSNFYHIILSIDMFIEILPLMYEMRLK